MRHARIQTTLDIYADAENSAMRDAAVSHALYIASDADTGVVDPDDIAAHEAWIEEMDG